jgi:hypothetical protein
VRSRSPTIDANMHAVGDRTLGAGAPTQSACPLPKLDLPAADWRSYFRHLYNDGSPLPESAEHVDVLNLTLLSTISEAASRYVAHLGAMFPRGHAWGSCFNGACGSGHFAGYLNVHCPSEFAWRLRLLTGQRDQGARHTPLHNHSWAEVTHCGGSDFEANAAFYYAARGSGLWINMGRTAAFGTHDDAVRHFLKRNCTLRGVGAHECDSFLQRVMAVAAHQGFDTVQFLGHCDAKCNTCLHEVALLREHGRLACPPVAYRSGSRAQLQCTCVEHSSSVGTKERPDRGGCASCVRGTLAAQEGAMEGSGIGTWRKPDPGRCTTCTEPDGALGSAKAGAGAVAQITHGPGNLRFSVSEIRRFPPGDPARFFSLVEPRARFHARDNAHLITPEVWLLARSGNWPSADKINVHVQLWRRCDAQLACDAPVNITGNSTDDENLAHNAAVSFRLSPGNGRSEKGFSVLLMGGRYNNNGQHFPAFDNAYTSLPSGQAKVLHRIRVAHRQRGVLLYSAESLKQMLAAKWNRSHVLTAQALRQAGCVERRSTHAPDCEFDGRLSIARLRGEWLLFGRANMAAGRDKRHGIFGGRHVQMTRSRSIEGPWSQFRLLQFEGYPDYVTAPVEAARNLYFAAIKPNPANMSTLLGLFAYTRDGDKYGSVSMALSCDGEHWSQLEPLVLTHRTSLGRGDIHPVDGWIVRNGSVHFYIHRGVPGTVPDGVTRSSKTPSTIERASVPVQALGSYTKWVLRQTQFCF